MFFLNRLRGTYSIFAKINAVLLGLISGYLTQDIYVGLAITLGYIAGESWGWGQWIGGLITKRHIIEGEGSNNGIRWITSKFFSEGEYSYNILALTIRGFYWWFLVLFALMFVMNPLYILVASLILAVGFPLSVIMATNYWGKDDTERWENAEMIYGGMQDIVLLILVGVLL